MEAQTSNIKGIYKLHLNRKEKKRNSENDGENVRVEEIYKNL